MVCFRYITVNNLHKGDNTDGNNNNNNNNFKNKILKEETESKCRLCKQHEETIDHITSGCPILAKKEYLMRHNKVCAHLHYSICTALGIKMTGNGKHPSKPVCEHLAAAI